MNYLKSITKEAINILPAHEFEGKILVIEDDAQAVDVARALAGEKLRPTMKYKIINNRIKFKQ